MRRFIITGAPGAGKTAIIRQLELDGFSVVEEAATDVIAAAHAQGTVEFWRHPSFIDAIAHVQEATYQNRVFFNRNLGFITPTEARRISFEETVRFEKIHEETYRDFGFELVSIEPGSLVERVSIIKAAIG